MHFVLLGQCCQLRLVNNPVVFSILAIQRSRLLCRNNLAYGFNGLASATGICKELLGQLLMRVGLNEGIPVTYNVPLSTSEQSHEGEWNANSYIHETAMFLSSQNGEQEGTGFLG
jgi:hypothetical protein